LAAVIKSLASHGRPLLCTEWLARSVGSTVDLLSVFKEAGVGAINWGLVDGRTQTRFPWRSWTEQVDVTSHGSMNFCTLTALPMTCKK